MSEKQWPFSPELDFIYSNEVIHLKTVSTAIAQHMEFWQEDLLHFELNFLISGRPNHVRFLSVMEPDSMLWLPYDSSEYTDLLEYLIRYQLLVVQGRYPANLRLSAHSDGWFSFDSDQEAATRLPKLDNCVMH